MNHKLQQTCKKCSPDKEPQNTLLQLVRYKTRHDYVPEQIHLNNGHNYTLLDLSENLDEK